LSPAAYRSVPRFQQRTTVLYAEPGLIDETRFQSLGIRREFLPKKLEDNETVKASVLGFINNPPPPPSFSKMWEWLMICPSASYTS